MRAASPASCQVGGLALALALVGVAGCGKDTGGAPTPRSESPASDPTVAEEGTPGSEGGETGGPPEVDRLPLDAEFHRTRVGLGTGMWVLGVVHNPHPDRVHRVRVLVGLLDAEAAVVGKAETRVARPLKPGERAAVAVHLADPVAHETLTLTATGVVDDGPEPTPLALELTHEPPQRAEFGGWYVTGRVHNPGATEVRGARVEIQGLDPSGQLLGVDWLELDPVEPGETLEFDVGDLRYEQNPANFLVELRPSPLPGPPRQN